MHKYSEVLEIDDSDSSIFNTRAGLIENSVGLGPPDMCYIIKECSRSPISWFYSRKNNKAYFHYRYGVISYSLSAVAAYFSYFINSWIKRTAKENIIFGCFCVYDLFSKLDIRVEIEIPGKTTAYLVNSEGKKLQTQEAHWEGAYLSSILRALCPIRATTVSCLKFFETIQEVENFMDIAQKFWPKLGFVLGSLEDVKKYGVNLLFPVFSKYLTRLKRFKLHNQLFRTHAEKDPLMLTYLAKSSVKLGKFDEIIFLIKNQISATPHAFPLYYSLARAYYKKQNYKKAINLCQYLIELNLDVYDYWHLLISCYIKVKDYNSAILCLNVIPYQKIEETKIDLEVPESRILVPQKLSYSGAGNIWIRPTEFDFRPFEDQAYFKSNKEKTLFSTLSSLPGSHLKGSMKKAYKLIVKLEKRIEWESLIKIKHSLLKKPRRSEFEEEKSNVCITSTMGNHIEFNRTGFKRTSNITISMDYQIEDDPIIDE